jgi:chaperonin GroEL
MATSRVPYRMTSRRTPRVVFQPAAYRGMQRGINQIVDAVRPTLGPLPRVVAIERVGWDGHPPQLFDDGGLIARRIFELPNRGEDVGAMFARQVLWQLHERVGDGTATAAVLMQAVFNEGVRYIISGGDAMKLRKHLEDGMQVVVGQLSQMSTAVEGEEMLAQVAETVCHDPPLARMLGEIFDIIAEYGQLDVRAGRTRELEREYVEGMFWEAGVFSRRMISSRPEARAEMQNAAILVSDLDIQDRRQLVPLLESCGRARIGSLLIIASRLSDDAAALLLGTSRDPDKFQAVAVRMPVDSTGSIAAIEDLAVLTGAEPLVREAGSSLKGFRVERLGRARRAWAERFRFGIVGGSGDPRALRQHIASLRQLFAQTAELSDRQRLQQRIGRLMGGSATLWVGSESQASIESREELAKRTAAALRTAILGGVVPGGGVSLLSCRTALREKLARCDDPDERAAYRILARAIEAPTRTILSNAGYDSGAALAKIEHAGPGHGFDVTSGQIVDAAQAGILDSTGVLQAAVQSAIRGAALALTVDVCVHHRNPAKANRP